MKFLFHLLLPLFIISLIVSSNLKTMNYNDCLYTLPDGLKVSFSHLRRGDDYMLQSFSFLYKGNFCGALVNTCHNSQSPGAIQLQSSLCFSLSTSWDAKIDYIESTDTSKGVKLMFPPGDKCYLRNHYQMVYYLHCDYAREINLDKVNRLQTCTYEYHFSSKYACPNNFIDPSSKFSAKNILFYLIVIFSVYCVGLSSLNYKLNPEDGLIKALPHRNFWTEFFSNALLGFRMIVQSIKEKLRNRDNDYNSY